MRNTILARRYARALFSLGKEQGKTEKYSELLAAIAALYDDSAVGVRDALTNPLYPLDARQKVMAQIGKSAKADKTMSSFLNLLVEKKRADILPDIAGEIQIMVDMDQNISHGSVVSAVELDGKLQESIQATLEKITGNKVILQTEVDPTIIGGIIAKVGDLVLDGSIKTQLNGLKESIKGEISQMQIKAEEISQIIKDQIAGYESDVDLKETGTVLSVGDGIARVYGVENCQAMELLEFPGNIFGLALNLEEDNVGCAVLGDVREIKEGDIVKRTGRIAEVPVGPEMEGRVVDGIGQPIDGKGPIDAKNFSKMEVLAPGVIARKGVHEPCYTGAKAVDAMTPVGKGQRELVIGDRQIGKTALCVDAIIAQKETDVHCIYVAIGQKKSTVALVVEALRKHGAMEYTTVVAACASDPAPMQYVSAFAGCAMGEYFRDNGQHALIIYDDLSKQAVSYRELSLLLRRPPGREAFPGDIFFNHSRLLERAAKVSDELGAGSLTALPIIETQAGDVSAFIPTNVISITDGQVYLEPSLFFAGVRPAINVGLSVSRVGGSAQVKAMKQVAGTLRLDLAQYRELAAFAGFGSDLDAATQAQLTRGERLVEILKQPQYQPLSMEKQVTIIFAGTKGFLDAFPVNTLADYEQEMYGYIEANEPSIFQELKDKEAISSELEEKMKKTLTSFGETFKATKGLN